MHLETGAVAVLGVPTLLWVGERAKISPFASPLARCKSLLFGPLKISVYRNYRLHNRTSWLSDRNIIASYDKNNMHPKHVTERNPYLEAQIMRQQSMTVVRYNRS